VGDVILSAAKNYADDVRQGIYPQPEAARRESGGVLALK